MCQSTLYRASLPHAALYIDSSNNVSQQSEKLIVSIYYYSVRIIHIIIISCNVLRSRLRDGAHALRNASATSSPLPSQQLHLYMLYIHYYRHPNIVIHGHILLFFHLIILWVHAPGAACSSQN